GGEDNPGGAFRRGVLARDGGHLHAVFPNEDGARGFIRRASELVGERLLGLLLTARPVKLQKAAEGWAAPREGEASGTEHPTGAAVADLPQLQVCEVTGQGPAARLEAPRPGGERRRWIAEAVQGRRDAADNFDRGSSSDVLGLLRPALVNAL